ncbi:hypothetical protein H4219_003218 [Mycoemilia scoparia]|uniref:Uncharacterized protein n=1 Tax=Mycoemilia scoparia TaxID=417184 RepID=A0A9W8DTP4_9FUNG|nr:hypothetical protein H4219_003218 [Mycoemilia scoparia]
MRIYRHRSLGDMRMSASKLGVIDEILSDNDDQDQDQLVPSNSSGGNRSKEEESGGGNDDKFDTLSQALNGEAGVTRWQSKLAKNQDYKRREVEVKDT